MITRDEWLRAVQEASVAAVESDQDSVTADEFAAMFNLNRQAATRRLKALEEAGRAVRVRKRVSDGMGRTVFWNAWKLVEPKKKRR